jgi:excisionase family DNA binding protein
MDEKGQTEPMFFRLSEAARLLSMSRSAAYEALRKGALPAVQIAGKWRVPRKALERLAAEAMRDSVNPPDKEIVKSDRVVIRKRHGTLGINSRGSGSPN